MGAAGVGGEDPVEPFVIFGVDVVIVIQDGELITHSDLPSLAYGTGHVESGKSIYNKLI